MLFFITKLKSISDGKGQSESQNSLWQGIKIGPAE